MAFHDYMTRKFWSIPVGSLLVISLVWLGPTLWFQLHSSWQDFAAEHAAVSSTNRPVPELRVLTNQPVDTLNPFSYQEEIVNKINLVYEGLVKFDAHLNIEPALAISWGTVNNTTWEFKLRRQVRFHNGHTFTADDVIKSWEVIRQDHSSLAVLLNNITSLEKKDDYTLLIHTAEPDPTLLAKLTNLYILPRRYLEFQKRDYINQHPIGTGPYSVQSFTPGKELVLSRFNNYYGRLPIQNEKITMTFIASKYERMQLIRQNLGDIVTTVSYDTRAFFLNHNYTLTDIPSLESTFLFFNFQHPLLQQKDVRRALKMGLDITKLADMFHATALRAFCPSGVFGFDPDINVPQFDPATARTILQTASPDKIFLTLDATRGSEKLAQIIQQQWAELNVKLELNIYDSETEFLEKIKSGTSQMYLLTWKFNLGDSGEFLDLVVHSRTPQHGLYNGSNYQNSVVDEQITTANHDLDESARLIKLQQIMRVITTEDVMGIPLLETTTTLGTRLIDGQPIIPLHPHYDGRFF